MKFYFCEKCGRRVTDLDLEQGRARDKQLKGIYCSECKVDVLTVEMDAVRILTPEKLSRNTPPTGTATHPTRSSQSRLVPLPRTKSGTDNQSHAPTPKRSNSLWLVSCIGGLLLALVLIKLPGVTCVPQTKVNSVAAMPPAKVHSTVNPNPAQVTSELAPTLRSPTEPRQEHRTQVAIDAPKPANDEVAPIARSISPPETAEPKVAVTEKLAPVQPVIPPEDSLLARILEALAVPDYALAKSRTKEDQVAPQSFRDSLASSLEALQQEQRSFQEVLQGLVGQEVRLETAQEVIRGKLLSADTVALKIERSIEMNGASGTYTAQIRFNDLTEACLSSTFKAREPATNEAWAARSLVRLASGNLAGANSALGHCDQQPLHTALRHILDTRIAAELEAQAEPVWKALVARIERANSQAQAKTLLNDIASYEERFGATTCGKDPVRNKQCAELRSGLDRLALGLDPRVAGLFKGKVLNYEPRSQTLTIEYDFQNPEQLTDFEGTDWKGKNELKLRKDGLYVNFSETSMPLQLPQYASNDVHISLTYQDRHNNNFFVCFYSINSSGRADLRLLFTTGDAGASLNLYRDQAEPALISLTPWTKKLSLPSSGRLDFYSKQKQFTMKINDETIVDVVHTASDHQGLGIGGGSGTSYLITRLRITGQLDARWLKKALQRK